jgi:hypothetical protein
MSNEKRFKDVIAEFRSDPTKKRTFAELMARVWEGKIIEVYIGDRYEDVKFDDSTMACPAVLIGKVIDAYGECLVLNCAYIDPASKVLKFGNIVCLNERSVRTITEVDNLGTLRETFLNSKDGKIIKGVHDGIK